MIKPTKEQVQAAAGKTIPDLISTDLKVLFCGINPGLYSGATGYHFARPGNRFWPALNAAGYTEEILKPDQGAMLLAAGYGITNLVERSTASAAEVTSEELISGRLMLEQKLQKFSPAILAVLGITAFHTAFDCNDAAFGLQKGKLKNVEIWILPKPSGLNAHFTPPALAEAFRDLYLYFSRI